MWSTNHVVDTWPWSKAEQSSGSESEEAEADFDALFDDNEEEDKQIVWGWASNLFFTQSHQVLILFINVNMESFGLIQPYYFS